MQDDGYAMGMFDKLFGHKEPPAPAAPPAPPPAPVPPPAAAPPPAAQKDLRDDPDYLLVYDKYGRETFIRKEDWRTSTLPGMLQAQWDNPDELADVITGGMHDGFFADVLEAAKHLSETDSNPRRGAVIYGVVLLKLGRSEDAERVFNEAIDRHGEDAVLLTNLARVYAEWKQNVRAGIILWHALELDPNFDSAFNWYCSVERDHGGADGEIAAFEKIAGLPGSWRAQIWLGRRALQAGDLPIALEMYDMALDNAGDPTPGDLLMTMSGDLGNAGQLEAMLRLAGPRFVARAHGVQVGNNLIKANLDLGHIDAAAKILEELYAMQRPDWKETLSFWDTAIAKARVTNRQSEAQTPLGYAMIPFPNPVWLKPESPAVELFPVPENADLRVSFLGCSISMPATPDHPEFQLSDRPGRLSRAVPFFLAEQAHFRNAAGVTTLVPWIAAEPGSFIVNGAGWTDEEVVTSATQADPAVRFAVLSHLIVPAPDSADPYKVDLRLLRTGDGSCAGELSASFQLDAMQAGLQHLADELVTLLAQTSGVRAAAAPVAYAVPAASFGDYLLRLEQLLAVRCAGMETHRGTLYGQREILDGMLNLCLTNPDNVPARLILAQALTIIRMRWPEISAQFSPRVGEMQLRAPIQGPAAPIVDLLFEEALGTPR
jgi:tetratricopeptide (TPR) repeat protein